MTVIKISELPEVGLPMNGTEYVLGIKDDQSYKFPVSTIRASVTISNARTTVTAVTGSIANDASVSLNITASIGYALYKVETSAAAWVRVYASAADRTADASRLIYQDPSSNSGVVAEVITNGSQIIRIAPGIIGYSDESTPTNIIPISVVNKSGSSANITVKLTILPLEN